MSKVKSLLSPAAAILPSTKTVCFAPRHDLKFSPRICTDKTIIVHNGPDGFLKDLFPYAETVIFNNCNKNFVYFNLNSDIFPRLETFYTNSHTCEPNVLRRFAIKPDYVSYVTTGHYNRYLNRWWTEDTHYVKKINDFEYEAYIGTFRQVHPTMESSE